MKKVKTVEFVCFIWILCGLFNFNLGQVQFSETESDLGAAEEQGPASTVINKCDTESFNSKEEVLQFNKAFGYFDPGDGIQWVLNFTFNSTPSFNRLRNRCKTQAVPIHLDSTSTSTPAPKLNSSSVSTAEHENKTKLISFQPEFIDYGFFTYKPSFLINRENYCVKKLSATFVTVEICESTSTSKSNSNSLPTLNKCCLFGNLLTIDKNQTAMCDYTEKSPWKPGNFIEHMEIYPNYNIGLPPCKLQIKFHYILPHQLAPQINRTKNSPITFKDIRVLENGQVETRDSGNHKWKKLEKNTYCVDGYQNQLVGSKATDKNPAYDFMVLECPAPEPSKIEDMIIAVACFISSFVALIIVIVYALTWNQQNIHGWTKCAFSLTMFFGLICTGVRLEHRTIGDFCTFSAVATHFFHFALFSWLLVMNFDLWSTISSMTPKNQRSKGKMRFLFFCCFGLGIPTIVVSISLIIEHQFSLFDDRVIRPQFGRSRCALDHSAIKAYNVYPTLILFLPNLIFIFLTMKIVWDLAKAKKKLQGQNSNINDAQKNKEQEIRKIKIKLCLKLFVIMGISWIFDIIPGLVETGEVSWYWMIPDIYNIAQPFLLFWLFICNKEIRDQLSEKYSFFKAGFKWMDVHVAHFSWANKATATAEQSESRSLTHTHATESTAFN